MTTSAKNGRATKVCEDCKAPFTPPPGNPQVVQCAKCWAEEDASCAALFAPKGARPKDQK